jgi:NhaA family Na+:H+ antiporter
MKKNSLSRLYESSHEFKPSVQRRVGILIFGCAVLAMVLINIVPDGYEDFLKSETVFGGLTWAKFIDKGLMSIFFFAAGMEIRHEFFHGHLKDNNLRKLPLYCAVGGVLAPLALMAVIGSISSMLSIGNSGDIFSGLPIPVATDIVFALAFLSFFVTRVPRSLRAFVLAFAVIDDLIGLVMLFILQGSISPTAIAVVLGFCVPKSIGTYQMRSHFLAKLLIVNSFIVLPVFAIANGGVSFEGVSPAEIASQPLFWAIILSQFLGKIIGIYFVSLFALRSPKLSIPRGCTKEHMMVGASVAAIGITLSIFLAKAAFEQDLEALLVAKLAVVVATIVAITFAVAITRKLPEIQKQ